MKVTCSKCKKVADGLKGETAAYILFLLTIPFVYFFGVSMISTAGLGLYVLLVHRSSKFVCKECLPNLCPGCGEKLQNKKYCKKCEIAICPFCGSHQRGKRALSLLSTAIGIVFFVLGFIVMIGLLFINFLWMFLFVLVLLYFSSPVCKTCGKRIHVEGF